jgi:hypothetical protein
MIRETRERLAFDDVVGLKKLGLTRLDTDVSQHRHQPLPELLPLLPRVPDLADLEVAVRTDYATSSPT